MATMRDIAQRLGVSVGTVSKGLNGGTDISEELRRSILDTAVELGYTNRRSQKEEHRKLAVFIENMDYQNVEDFGYEIVLGFKTAANRDHWAVDIIEADRDFQNREKYETWMLQKGYSAGFFLGFSLEDPWMEQFHETSMPTALLDNYILLNPHVAMVGTDSEEAMDLAIGHLRSLGHEKIAFLNGSAHSYISDQRMISYLSSMARHHLHIDPSIAVYGYYVAEAAGYHVPGFLQKGVTAILCGNDRIAEGVIRCCKASGYSVPEDISVVGFDDIPLAQRLDPPLTTIRQSRSELGRCGYYTLYSMISGVAVSRNLLRPSLVVRETTAIARPRIATGHPEEKDSVLSVNPDLYKSFAIQRTL